LVITRVQTLAERLSTALDAERYRVRWAPSAVHALALDLTPSLLILDLPPSGGARNVIRLKRHFQAPLLALSGADQAVPDQVDGALCRPWLMDRLVELIQATLMASAPHVVQGAGMSLDTETRQLQFRGRFCQLPPIGCEILALLIMRAGTTVPRQELFRCVWHTDDDDSTRVLDVHIAQLRRLVETDPRRPTVICTERGVGYWLQPPD
jgi:DNA-binding response OmpR family regulator